MTRDGLSAATTLQASALEVRSGEIQKGIIAKAIGVAFAQVCDLDDAQGELSRRVLVGIGSKATPALLNGLPCLIEGVSQDFHLVGVEGSERVLYQDSQHGPQRSK